MNGREVYEAIYSGEKFDRIPLSSIGAWTETLDRWRREGLMADEDPNHAINLLSDERMSLPLNLNMYPLFEIDILEQSGDYVVLRDEFGVTKRMLRADFDRSEGLKTEAGTSSSMSQWLDFPVKDMASWKRVYAERFCSTSEGRIPNDWHDQGESFRVRSDTRWVRYFSFPFGGLFSAVRELMGLEGAIFSMADDPDLVHAIVDDLSSFYLETFALMIPEYRLDQMTCFEDMCSNRAPLLSPSMFREFFAPGYMKYIGGLKEMGVKHVFIDTDGDARRIIPELINCGFTGVHPCEIKAGMDPEELRRQFPELCCNGGIDKVAIATGGDELAAEIARRFRTAWNLGRYTPGLDHSAPPDISWENAGRYAHDVRMWCESAQGLRN